MATTRKRPSDICAEFGIQPFVLKFWEGEFPSLGSRLGPKRSYGPVEREMVREIHRLVEQDRCTLAEARRQIEERFPDGEPSQTTTAPSEPAPERPAPISMPRVEEEGRQLEREMQTLTDQLDRANSELDDLRQRLLEMKSERDEAQRRVQELVTEVSACIIEADEIVKETEATLMKLAPSHRAAGPRGVDEGGAPEPTPADLDETPQPPLFPGQTDA